MTADQRGMATGIGNTNTLSLGLITARAPPKAKTAPEAPIAIEYGGARSMNKRLPTIPPQK